jgi:deoxyribodipyrimidine photolyase-related protein
VQNIAVKGAEAKDINNQKVPLVFPHQLFENNPALKKGEDVFLVEEHLFYRQYRFHKRKIAFQKVGRKFYEDRLKYEGFNVQCIESSKDILDR